ncbi:hypothetical protein GCM10023206_21140 [Acinetobacter puyangensis]|uniref:Uncharacterized protein n=1 Tax=Acinetobacter puyangensis TaxID=1096779 RepID=A0A240ED09_9GAMM|nr:hypothetical protein [Acinetobacter puyangensis]SNX46584.1 hypothetical protein SAMN05421731_11370 [Acinetobacter puyangensis]
MIDDNREKVVSLKLILEKLFDQEQLNREQHIQYIAHLLSSQPTNHYLIGLQLDHLDCDVKTTSAMMNPIALIASRKQPVKSAPVTWYVNSIAQLDQSQQHALIWNILVLKAAIYLIALPEIRPDLFKNSHTEHFNTAKRLFQRFRAANKVLNKDKKYQNSPEYMQLWHHHLQDPTLSLEEFVKYLDNTHTSNDFENNLLNDIRITFTYVLKNKAKIARASIETRLQHDFIDEDELIIETSEIQKGSKAKALNIEKQLDDQDTRQILLDPTNVTPIAAYSESSQSYILPLVAKHIQRKEHLLPCSSLFPNKTSISALLNKLFNDHMQHQNGKTSLILMLAFLTGNKIQEWIKLQSKRVKALNSRQKLILKNDQYFLRSKFTIFENKDFAYPHALLNQTVYLDIPIPNHFITSLQQGELIKENDLQKYLARLRQDLYIPKLSLIKVSSLLHQTILQKTGNKQLADLLTGIDANKSSSISYCHQHMPTLHAQYVTILTDLCLSLGKVYQNIESTSLDHFGSRKAPKAHVVQDVFAILKFNIFSQNTTDWIAIFNHYNIWMWHFLLLFTAARPVSEFPGFLNRFNLRRKILMVSDKEVGGRQGYGRLIPLSPFVVEELEKFIEFLSYFKSQFIPNHLEIQHHVEEILDSKRPLLNIIRDDQCLSLSPSIVKNFNPELGLEHANWHRHTARAFLSNKISETEILALFGHEPMQQEAAHPFSSLSISQYAKIANFLEQMKIHFNIHGIQLNVLIQ